MVGANWQFTPTDFSFKQNLGMGKGLVIDYHLILYRPEIFA
jgi:hypothetical protein